MLMELFQILYDDNLIDKIVFYKWVNNPRGKGHGIAQNILKDFFETISRPKVEE